MDVMDANAVQHRLNDARPVEQQLLRRLLSTTKRMRRK